MKDYPEPDPRIQIVVFDLDGTLAESAWPIRGAIGAPIREGVEMLMHYAAKGYRVEIYTARPKIDEENIWAWAKFHGIPVDAVTCGKPFGGLYIDDRAFNFGGGKVEKPSPDEEWDDNEIERLT